MIERAKRRRQVNIRKLRPHVRQILRDDLVGRAVPMAYEELRAFLLAFATLTGKGILDYEKSLSLLADLWEQHPEMVSTDEALYRAVETVAAEQLLGPWVTLSEGAIHGAALGMLVVVQRSRQTLEETRSQYADTWGYYEPPPELLAD